MSLRFIEEFIENLLLQDKVLGSAGRKVNKRDEGSVVMSHL